MGGRKAPWEEEAFKGALGRLESWAEVQAHRGCPWGGREEKDGALAGTWAELTPSGYLESEKPGPLPTNAMQGPHSHPARCRCVTWAELPLNFSFLVSVRVNEAGRQCSFASPFPQSGLSSDVQSRTSSESGEFPMHRRVQAEVKGMHRCVLVVQSSRVSQSL